MTVPARLLIAITTALVVEPPVMAQPAAPAVDYELSFENAVHHEAQITATWRNVGTAPLRVQMSRSSPGRYAIHEFAKNVYSVSAQDSRGRPLPVLRTDPYGWTVVGHDGTVRLSYTLYADRADGTYSQIDATHAHLNMPATLMWAPGYEQRPVRVRFRPLDRRWKVATQLAPGRDRYSFTAPNLQYLLDSPAELSDHDLRQWQVRSGSRRYIIRLAVHHQGASKREIDELADRTRRIVAEQIALFGEAPAYDYGTYTFIVDALPHASGDGMEHRNSTVITGSAPLLSDNGPTGTISHEYFHGWNVERLRPRELEPFDFTRANPTPSLWFAEGFTTYYSPLFLKRAGVTTLPQFLQDVGGMLNGVLNSPGRRYGSPEEMSIRAPFIDAAVSIDPATPNIITNYYPYGAIVGLALDLMLRERGSSLDAYMRHMWVRNGRREIPFTPADLQAGLAELTRDPAFAEQFFRTSIRSFALPDFTPLLNQAGLTLRPAKPGAAYVGGFVKEQGGKVIVAEPTQPGTPLYRAGLDNGDEIVAVGATKIASVQAWERAIAALKPGNTVPIRFIQRGGERSGSVQVRSDPTLEIVANEDIGIGVTPSQRAFRNAWLGSKAAPPGRSR